MCVCACVRACVRACARAPLVTDGLPRTDDWILKWLYTSNRSIDRVAKAHHRSVS